MINLVNITKDESYMLLRILNVSVSANSEYDDFPSTMENLVRKLIKAVPKYNPYESRSGFDTRLASLMVKIKNETASTTTSRKK